PPDILSLAYNQPVMHGQMVLIQEKEQQIPGSVQYFIKRYQRNPQWTVDDTGMMIYHFRKDDPRENYLELKFCVTGNIYCNQKNVNCGECKSGIFNNCSNKVDTIDVLSFKFSSVHLAQFARLNDPENTLTDDILNFRHPSSFSKILSI